MTVKEFKVKGFKEAPIYVHKPYIVTSEGCVMIAGTLEEIKRQLDDVDTYYDKCIIEVRRYDLHLNDNTRIKEVSKMKRELGEVWKEEPQWDKQGKWKVQFPKGIMIFKTKKEALEAQRCFNLKKDGKERLVVKVERKNPRLVHFTLKSNAWKKGSEEVVSVYLNEQGNLELLPPKYGVTVLPPYEG